MTNKEIVEANMGLILQCVDCQFAKMSDKRYKDDFTNDLILILMTYDNGKMNNAVENRHFNALVSRIIINNIFSMTSPYYASYKRFEDRRVEGYIKEYGEREEEQEPEQD